MHSIQSGINSDCAMLTTYQIELLRGRRCRITVEHAGCASLPGRDFSLDDAAHHEHAMAIACWSLLLDVGEVQRGLGSRPRYDLLLIDGHAWDSQMRGVDMAEADQCCAGE